MGYLFTSANKEKYDQVDYLRSRNPSYLSSKLSIIWFYSNWIEKYIIIRSSFQGQFQSNAYWSVRSSFLAP